MLIRHSILLLVIGLLLANQAAALNTYDPLKVDDPNTPDVLDFNIIDLNRKRQIPLRIYLPSQEKPAPIVLFSYGLGGSCKGNAYMGNHWAQRGYIAVFVQHPGSDTSVWKDVPLAKRMTAMKKAADSKNYILCAKDIPVVLNQLEKWNKTKDHTLYHRLNLNRVGMSGYSFGAVTTQAVSGQVIWVWYARVYG